MWPSSTKSESNQSNRESDPYSPTIRERSTALSLPYMKYFEIPAANQAPPPNAMWLWTESCAFKATTGVLIGGIMGVFMGMFFGVLGAEPSVGVGPGGRLIPQAPLVDQLRATSRTLGEKMIWYAKSFSVITALFSGLDCLFEKGRGKHDALNGALSGCTAGAVLAAKQGPQAMCLGCGGFAAFTVAVEALMASTQE
mmetsp:Transcript_12604/g.16963  ORF Transcript_12604/g.16963 Transcript_12604/m.16963 type:complete len:197 (+) Transcript_12604:71-661(+)